MNIVLRSLLSMAGGEKDPHLVDRMSAFKGYVFHIDQSSNTMSTTTSEGNGRDMDHCAN